MILEVLCEQLERILKGRWSSNNKIPTKNEIALHIKQGFAVMINQGAYENYKISGGELIISDQYITTLLDQPVVREGRDFVVHLTTLPIEVRNGYGVLSVKPSTCDSLTYYPIEAKDLHGILGNSTRSKINRVMYLRKGKKLILIKTGSRLIAPKVDIDLTAVPELEMKGEIDATDDVIANIIDYVLDKYRNALVPKQDLTTDGIDETKI